MYIWVSMVAFSNQTQSFSAYGGAMTMTRVGTYTLDLIDIFSKMDSSIYGLNSFRVNTTQESILDVNIDH